MNTIAGMPTKFELKFVPIDWLMIPDRPWGTYFIDQNAHWVLKDGTHAIQTGIQSMARHSRADLARTLIERFDFKVEIVMVPITYIRVDYRDVFEYGEYAGLEERYILPTEAPCCGLKDLGHKLDCRFAR